MTTTPDLDTQPLDDASRHRPADSVLAAERATVGAALYSAKNADLIAETLTAADFWDPELAVVFQACCELSGSGQPVDIVTVHHHLTTTEQLGMLRRGGPALLGKLLSEAPVPHPDAISRHADIVADDAHRRRMHAEAVRAAQFTGSPSFTRDDTDLVLARMQQAATHARRGETEALWLADDLDATLDAIENHDDSKKILTPWADINSGISIEPGQLVVIAARPGGGKTLAGLNIAAHTAIRRSEGVLFASLEMTRAQLQRRLLASEGKINLNRLEHNTMQADDWAAVGRIQPALTKAPILIDDATDTNPARLRARLRYMRTRVTTRVIVVDYLQLMKGTGRYERRDLEVADITRTLKILAKTEDVCVIALCQLNRGPEMRADKKPILADLRESGSIENDADTVILLHRPDRDEVESPRAGEFDMIVAKQRSGPQFVATLAWQGHYARIVDMAGSR